MFPMFIRNGLAIWLILGGGGAAAARTIPDELTLERAIEMALAHHADLESARIAIEAKKGAERQAGFSPNPVLSFQTENWRAWQAPSFSAGRDLDLFVFVSQPLELGGRKDRRVGLAASERRIAEFSQQAAAWRIRQQVKLAYWKVLTAEKRQKLLTRSIDTFSKIVEYHDARVRLGAMAEADLIKVRLESERFAMAHSTASMEAEKAKYELVRSLGIPSVSAHYRVVESAMPSSLVDWQGAELRQKLEQASQNHHPDVLLLNAMVERADSAVLLAKALGKPNVSPYFGYKRTEGFNTLIGGISVSLPIHDRNAGRIEEALAEVRQSKAQLRAVQTRVRAEVAAAHVGVARRAAMLQRMEAAMLQPSEETLQIAVAAYQEGDTDLFRLLDAQRARIDIQLLHVQTAYDYALSLVALETAVGTEALPIPERGRKP